MKKEPVWTVFAAYAAAVALILWTSHPIEALMAPAGGLAAVSLSLILVKSLRIAAVFLVAALAVSSRPRRESLRLSAGRLTGQHVFIIAVGGVALGQALSYGGLLLGMREPAGWKPVQEALTEAHGAWLFAALLVIGVLSAGSQELFFRGAMQTRLSRRFGPTPAILVTSVCFGLLQMHPAGLVTAGLLGLYAGYFTELSGSVWAGIAAHVAHNTLATGLAPLEDPTAAGPTAGLFLLALGVAVAAFLWLRRAIPGR